MIQPASPKKASTVILIRPDIQGKFEVFMTLRPAEMKFLGGFYVFPGGSIRKRDYSEAMLNRCHGLSGVEAQRILGNQLSAELAMGHWVAGIRELFEEVGILLCVTEAGEPMDMTQDKLKDRLAEKREALVQGSLDFPTLLKSEGLLCDLDRAVFFYHRVTPEMYSIRFDARFYLAQLPRGQSPLTSSEEVADGLWITPEQVLEASEKGDFPVIPPTTTSLRTLAAFDSWQSLCAEYRLH